MRRRNQALWFSVLLLGPLPSFADVLTPSGDPPSICNAVAGNLVLNCGFETGDTTGWVFTPAPSGSNFGVEGGEFANSGAFGAQFGATDPFDDFLSQTLSDHAGSDYTFSFYVTNLGDAPADNADFTAEWNGTLVYSAPTTAFPYTQESFTVMGTGNDTITFSGRQLDSWYALDDVVVRQSPSVVPEPGYMALLAIGLLGGIVLARRRRSELAN
jgi:hypothetical protein